MDSSANIELLTYSQLEQIVPRVCGNMWGGGEVVGSSGGEGGGSRE